MTEKRDPTKEYENKEILPEKETDYFGWLESWFRDDSKVEDFSVYMCLETCRTFESDTYWESGVNRFDTNKKSAMHHCVDYLIKNQDYANNTNVVLKAWDDVNKYKNPWEHAVHIFLFLLNAGVSINSRKLHPYDIHQTPLEYAIANGANRHVLELLIKHGAYVNSFEFNGYTPLMGAIDSCNVEAVEVLVNAGVDLDAFDEKDETALHKAFDWILNTKDPLEHYSEVLKIIDILLNSGANPNKHNIFLKSCIETQSSNYDIHYREEQLGIGLEMAELRNRVRKIALSFNKNLRSEKKVVAPDTVILNEFGKRTEHKFEQDWEVYILKVDLALEFFDEVVIHYYKNKPIPEELIKKIEALDIEISDPLIHRILYGYNKNLLEE